MRSCKSHRAREASLRSVTGTQAGMIVSFEGRTVGNFNDENIKAKNHNARRHV